MIRSKGEAPAVLTFDHGPVGYLSIAAHGHADLWPFGCRSEASLFLSTQAPIVTTRPER